MQLVEIVASNAKFHLSQDRTNHSTVTNVFQSINQKAEEAQVAEDLEVEVAAEVATEEALTEDHEKCTKRLVEIVVKIAKFHLSQDRTNQSTVTNVFQSINQKAEEAQVVEDLAVEVALAEEVDMTEDHEKCTKQLVETAVRNVKFHSSQNRTSQSTAANAFKVIKEIKDN